MVTFFLYYHGRSFLGYVWAMEGFFGRVARNGLIEGFSRYNLGFWTRSVMVLVGQQQAPKLASFTCFPLRSGASRQDFGYIRLPWRRISTGLCRGHSKLIWWATGSLELVLRCGDPRLSFSFTTLLLSSLLFLQINEPPL